MYLLRGRLIKGQAFCLDNGFLKKCFMLLAFIYFLLGVTHTSLAGNITVKPYFIYGFMSNGESFSLSEWIGNQNQYHQKAYDNCVQSYPQDGEKYCELSQVSGTYNYPGATTRNGVQNPQGITWQKTKNGITSSMSGQIVVATKCPIGFSLKLNSSDYECVKQEPQTCEAAGDPINILTGDKFEYEIDYQSADGLLKVERIYIDQLTGWSMNVAEHLFDPTQKNSKVCLNVVQQELIQYTFANPSNPNEVEKRIHVFCSIVSNADEVYIQVGRLRHLFKKIGNVYLGDGRAGFNFKLERISAIYGSEEEWKFTNSNGDESYFNSYGYLIRKKFSTGDELTYLYSNDRLIGVQDNRGRSLGYTYDIEGRLIQISLPDGKVVDYEYSIYDKSPESNLIRRVVWSNGESKTYLYNEATYIDANSNSKYLLTGKLDSYDQRTDVTKYQNNKAVYNEVALSLQPRTFIRNSSVSVKDGLNATRVYTYGNALADGSRLLSSTNQPAGSGCAAATKSATYYADGLKKSETNFNGHKTQFAYEAGRALETVRVEGIPKGNGVDYLPANAVLVAGTRKVTTQWHSVHRKPVKKAEPKLITTFIYNGDADPFKNNLIANCAPVSLPLLCRKVRQATTDANGATGLSASLDSSLSARHEIYTYNSRGQQLTFARSSSGSPEETREYYETTTANWTLGDLKKITNALGQAIQFTRYDRNGRLLEMLDANNVPTTFTYDVRGRVLTQALAGDTVAYSYDLNGNRVSSVLPNGMTFSYHYDAAKRLTAVENSMGEKINYEYDVENNLRFERITSASGSATYIKQQIYDALSRIQNTLNSNNQGSTYLYDARGNLTGEIDANNKSTVHSIDPLDRLTRITDPLNSKTEFTYDDQGNVTQVKDARNNSTIYSYNAFGDLVAQSSPDTGITNFTYDALGNRTGSLDARSVQVSYSYDALNRLVAVQYPAGVSENISYSYDSTSNNNYGVGRLTGIQTASVHLNFEYDAKGLVRKKYTQVANTFSSVGYVYDAAGNITSITFPSGRIVNYHYSAQGVIDSISTQVNSSAAQQTLINDIDYLPFGPAKLFRYGNNLTHTQTFDTDYRLTATHVGGIMSRSYGYDPVNNITSILNNLNAANNQTYNYDALNRLISASGGYGNLGYSYDAVGNRLSETRNGSTDSYTYPSTNNRLQQITRTSGNRHFTYDAAGNPQQRTADDNSAQTFTFNKANRLETVSVNGALAATYTYNPLGQRVMKTLANGNKEIYHYDEAGQLIAVTDGTGATLREYIYWGNQQIAFVANGATYYIHSDHLNTPQVITNQSQQVVWMANYEPFGKLAANQSNSIELFSRFPGQYVDPETGLYYNYFRDYDPSIGRYIESDPIGLEGGVNTYAYTGLNPLRYIDYFGLEFLTPEEGQRIADVARGWTGVPYLPGGGPNASRDGADCSGATWAIYAIAGYPYYYAPSSSFPVNSWAPDHVSFLPSPGNVPQVGDVGRWNGHVLIYDPNAGGKNDSWSARRPGVPFGPAQSSWWGGGVTWYRYNKPDNHCDCSGY